MFLFHMKCFIVKMTVGQARFTSFNYHSNIRHRMKNVKIFTIYVLSPVFMLFYVSDVQRFIRHQ